MLYESGGSGLDERLHMSFKKVYTCIYTAAYFKQGCITLSGYIGEDFGHFYEPEKN
jgi:hypothetical protein